MQVVAGILVTFSSQVGEGPICLCMFLQWNAVVGLIPKASSSSLMVAPILMSRMYKQVTTFLVSHVLRYVLQQGNPFPIHNHNPVFNINYWFRSSSKEIRL